MATLAEVNVRIGADIRQFQRGLKSAERDLLRTGKAFTSVGDNLSKSLTLPIAAAAAAAFKLSADFETSFTKIKTLVGISGAQLDKFRDGIKSLSGPLGASQTQLSDALFVITSAGLRGDEAMQALEQASKATSIGLGETADVARVAAAAVTAYGDSGLTSGAAIDQLTAIVRAGNLEASELAPALGKVLPVASQMGVSFAEVGASVAAFSKLGVSAGESVSGLKALLSNILKPSSDAAKEFARIGVSADDLRKSIKERGLATTLQELVKSYGDNTEGLSKIIPSVEGLAVALGTAGAQGEDYVKIVNEIATSNGIVNDGFEEVSQTANFKLKQALEGLKASASQFGSVLIPVVTGILDKVNPLVQSFSNLSEGQKELAVRGALVAASLGPIASISGRLITNFASLRKGVQNVAGVYKIATTGFAAARSELLEQGVVMSGLTIRIKAARAAFATLNTVTKASIIGLIAVGIAAAVVAFKNYNAELTTAQIKQNNLNTINQAAEKSLSSQKAEVAKLTSALKLKSNTDEENASIRKRIISLNPAYLQGLIDEKSSFEDVTKALDGYLDNLRQTARLRAANERLTELYSQLDDIKALAEESGPTLWQAATNGIAGFGSVGRTAMLNAKDAVSNYQGNVSDLEKQIESTLGIIQNLDSAGGGSIAAPDFEETGAAPTVPGLNFDVDNTNAQTDALAALKAERAAYTEVAILGNEALSETNLISQTAQDLQAVSIENAPLLAEALIAETEEMIRQNEVRESTLEKMARQEKRQSNLVSVAQAMGNALASASDRGVKGFKNLALSAAAAGAKIVKSLIQQGVAAAVAGALKSLPPPAGLILGAIAGGAAAALFSSTISSIGIPALADGAIAYGPTLAYVGEYGGASSNPEVIAPLDKLKSIMKDSGGGGGAVEVFGTISGENIYLSSKRFQSSQVYLKGY